MQKIKTFFNLLKNNKDFIPQAIFDNLKKQPFSRIIPDSLYIRFAYFALMQRKLNLNAPVTFDEKLNWMKLYDRNPLYTILVDKYAVKEWVAERIGEKYVIPTLGVWDKFDDIEFNKLPDQFVLKCTHDSGGLAICKDKESFNLDEARKKIMKSLKEKYYYEYREWPYKNVTPRIIAEKYMEDSRDCELRDYKFYTFNGEPKFLLLATNRQKLDKPLCFDYFDMEFNHLPLTNHWHPNNSDDPPHKPLHFKEMQSLVKRLAEGFPQVRVDFYEVNGDVFFGEMTFFDQGGFLKLHPDSWEKEWGSLITLPPKE